MVIIELQARPALLPSREGLSPGQFRAFLAASIVRAKKPTADTSMGESLRQLRSLRKATFHLKRLLDPPETPKRSLLDGAIQRFLKEVDSNPILLRAARVERRAVRRGTRQTAVQRQAMYLYGVYYLFADKRVRRPVFYSRYLPAMLELSFPKFRFKTGNALLQQLKVAGGLAEAVQSVGWDACRYPQYPDLAEALRKEPVRFLKRPKGVRPVLVFFPDEMEEDPDEVFETALLHYCKQPKHRKKLLFLPPWYEPPASIRDRCSRLVDK